jgi:DeoR/GlpR family transcriptional regulator of sugar metabolism
MRAVERRAEIERVLSLDRQVGVDDLAKLLGVTASTIRRDLSHLTNQGVVTRTYGGAVMSSGGSPEEPLWQRSQEARAEKDAIGRWAASQVASGETVILDAGTTVGRLAYHLRNRTNNRVITNGLTSILELSNALGIELTVLGGEVRHISQGLVGPLCEATLMRLSADRVFLGADGLDAERGICEASTVQTRLKEVMMTRAAKTYVLTDSRKLGQAPLTAWAPLDRPWTLVTDDGATDDQLRDFYARPHVEVVVVPTIRDMT